MYNSKYFATFWQTLANLATATHAYKYNCRNLVWSPALGPLSVCNTGRVEVNRVSVDANDSIEGHDGTECSRLISPVTCSSCGLRHVCQRRRCGNCNAVKLRGRLIEGSLRVQLVRGPQVKSVMKRNARDTNFAYRTSGYDIGKTYRQ